MTATDATDIHTDEIDGDEQCGLWVSIHTGRIYEFQDPADHDDYARWVEPGTGDEIVHDSWGELMMGQAMGNQRLAVPVEHWRGVRDEYAADVATTDTTADRLAWIADWAQGQIDQLGAEADA